MFVDIDDNEELEAHNSTGDAKDGLDDARPAITSAPATSEPAASPFNIDDM